MSARRYATLAALLAACSGEAAIEYGMEAAETWPQPPLLSPPSGPRLAITNTADDTVSLLDAATYEEIARIPMGFFPLEIEGPHHLAAAPDGRFLYVGLSNQAPPGGEVDGPHAAHALGTTDGYVVQVDAISGRQVDRIRVGRNPGDVRLEPSGRRVWLSHFDLSRVEEGLQRDDPERMNAPVVVVEVPAMRRVKTIFACPASHGVVFSEEHGEAYVACDYSDEVAVIDVASLTLVARVPVAGDPGEPGRPRYEPYALAADPATGLVWASNVGTGRRGLRVIDLREKAAVDGLVLATEGAPFFGDFRADGSRFYVPTQAPDRLLEIDPATASVLREVDLGPLGCRSPHAAELAPGDGAIWIVCEGDRTSEPGALLVLEPVALSRVALTELGLYPDDVVLLPEPAAP